MKSAIVIGIIGVGFLLLALGSLWTALFPPTLSWTPEKAQRMSEVKARLNNLSFAINAPPRMHAGPDPATLKAESVELQKEFDQLKADFESTTSRSSAMSTGLKWSGISLAVIGLIGWYVVKQSS